MNLPVTEGDTCFVRDGFPDLCSSFTPTGAGSFQIDGVPASTAGAVRFRGPAIATFYWVLTTGTEDLELQLSVDTPTVVQGYYDQTAVTPTADSVVVLAEIYPDKRADYVALLTPESGEGPFYYDSFFGHLGLEATATSSNIAMGVFLDVDPDAGPFSLSFSRGEITCSLPSYGGPRESWAIPADADVVYQAFACPP